MAADFLNYWRTQMENKYLECAVIVGTHGVHGALRLNSMCDTPEVLASLPKMFRKTNDGFVKLSVSHSFVQKSTAVVSFNEISSLEEAIPMKNVTLYAERDDIPKEKGAFFISDLIGLEVRDEDSSELYGNLKEVISPAGQDIYVVSGNNGEFMIPCVPEFVIRISPSEGVITIRPIEGMIG